MMLKVVPSPGAMSTEAAKFLNYSANIFLVITALEEFGVSLSKTVLHKTMQSGN